MRRRPPGQGGLKAISGRDPCDEGRPREKAWQEFRASFSAALLYLWMLADVEELFPDYASVLHNRFMSGSDHYHVGKQDDDTWKWYLVPGPGGLNDIDSYLWLEEEDWQSLYQQLFPHVSTAGEHKDFEFMALGAAAILLHSALETYAEALHGGKIRGPLPRHVENFLESEIDSTSYRNLLKLDQTRHLFVHNRGIVDDKYRDDVQECRFQVGEFRILKQDELRDFSRAAWKIARLLREEARSR